MPGILGVIHARGVSRSAFARAASTLNLLDRSPPAFLSTGEARLAVATMPDPPLAGPFHYEDDHCAACFAGDLYNRDAIPWRDIAACCRRGDFGWATRVEGHFAAAVYHKRDERLHLFADHFGCYPIFYARHDGGLVFSSQLAAFVRLGSGGGFDREWLHRFLFFGYWPGSGTFLDGVKRVPPGTVMCFDGREGSLEWIPYEKRFTVVDPPLRGREAIDRALAVFRRHVPPMYRSDRNVVWALSGGLDSRTVYAFLPEKGACAAFTYGMPGCHDHEEAAAAARRLGVPHRQLFFDEAYEKRLPGLLLETVWLSGGLAWVNRAMLPAVYRFVGSEFGSSPILTSGISLDTLFRGHNNAQGDLNHLLATGAVTFHDPAYGEILPGEDLKRFHETNAALAAELGREHGRLSQPASYLSYTVYTLCPSYFTADLEIGGHFAALRVPGYHRSIVELAYLLEYSTVYLSKYVPHALFDEYILEANLMASHPKLSRIPLHGIPLGVYVRGDRLGYHLHRTFRHGMRYVRRGVFSKGTVAIEDWQRWSRTVLAPGLKEILGPGALVSQYVRPGVVDDYLTNHRWKWLARLATVELILQLMDNGWELRRLPYAAADSPVYSGSPPVTVFKMVPR